MAEKQTPRNCPGPVAEILADLDSPEPSRRARVIDECWDFVPHVGAILAALLRGLNDDDEFVRLQAFKGLLHAFPVPLRPRSAACSLTSRASSRKSAWQQSTGYL